MYRHADENWNDEPEAQLPHEPFRWKPTPVPLAVLAAFFSLGAEFFGMFLLGWAVAPTSIGCGAGRAATMVAAQIPIALVPAVFVGGVGYTILAEGGASQHRRRSYLMIFGVLTALGSIPLFVAAGLLGSCFDF